MTSTQGNPMTSARLFGIRAPVLSWLALLIGCSGGDPVGDTPTEPVDDSGVVTCELDPLYFVQTGVAKDGIPSLDDPTWLPADHGTDLWFLLPFDRVIGFTVEGQAYAVPHNLLWYHEIANVSIQTPSGPLDLAITFCPLTGSSLIFDRAAAGGAEFGVSGLLYQSNLLMYDRNTSESLWPQMLGQARCGVAHGNSLTLYPSIEMRWDGWLTLHPDTRVLGSPVGNRGPYDIYPYGGYESPNSGYSFPMPQIDPRRPLKERVLGVIAEDGGSVAFPFGVLQTLGPYGVVEWSHGSEQAPALVFWDRTREAAAAFSPRVGEEDLTFIGDPNGIFDTETGTRWTVDGVGVEGPLAGTRLEPIGFSYVAFWGALYAFHPNIEMWGPAKPTP